MPTPVSLPPLVDAAWVRSHPEAVPADVRWYLDGRSGRDAYLRGHLPGAVWVDVDTVLSAPPTRTGGRHPIPSAEDFARALGGLGIGEDDVVVAYDDNGGAYAARLVWLLRRLGFPAALLDGGLTAWTPLENGEVIRPPVTRRAVPWPEGMFLSAGQVERMASLGSGVVLDARAPGRYAGADVLPGEPRAGHIPGAVSAPWAGNLTADGVFLPPERLRLRYRELGVDGDTEVAVYCGSGVTACHDLLALELIGAGAAALYPGSWSAWSADPRRPVVRGDRPWPHDQEEARA
ncbi:sulfurtransferase [Microbispora sp. NPDC046973]|uniref:sulfurtransferase n=1 Tax=Microbispora sp. NPDC046973 TaxID=3155022 RepID=UPI0033F53F73